MKKLIVSTLATVVFSIFSPVTTPVHAGIIQDQLTQVIAQDANVVRIQQMLTVKKQLEQGNKEEILATLANAALVQSNQGGLANIANAVTKGNISQIAESALFQQVQNKITERMTPYEKELGILATLFNNQLVVPKAPVDSKVALTAPQNYKRIIDMTATAYAPGPLDNGKWNNLTYMGGNVRHGVVAVDPRVIPMGTKLWVEGYGEAVAEDQGSAIKGNRIDLVFEDRNEALDYGIKNLKVYVLS